MTHDPIRIPLDSITHNLVGAGGLPRVIVAGQTYELFASGDLARIIRDAKTRELRSRRAQPEQAKKDLE